MDSKEIALVLTDPQNDFLSEASVAWELVGRSVQDNGTVQNIERPLESAKSGGTPVFVSPTTTPLTISGSSAPRRNSDAAHEHLNSYCMSEFEVFEGGKVGLVVGGEMGDLVEEPANGDLFANGEEGSVYPFSGQG